MLLTEIIRRFNMTSFKVFTISAVALAVAGLTGCSTTSTKAADVTASVRNSLDQAGLKDVSVSQDRDKGVVTLGGHVPADADKTQAASIAQSFAGTQVVANEIAVVMTGAESDSKKVNAALDKAIEGNLDVAMVKAKLRDVKYAVNNHVVTLTGTVNSPANRKLAETTAAAVADVQQVVNELQVKGQKATSMN
jgi:hyperosmotically inducible protein